jgi:thymidylate kinase
VVLMFIALEGIDGSGKTTVGATLGKRLGATVLRVPAVEYGLTGAHVDRRPGSTSHFFFYLSALFWASEMVTDLRAVGQHVVADRYALSTFAYHAPFLAPPVQLTALGVEKPDLTVLLTVDERERRRRLASRNIAPPLIERLLEDGHVRRQVMRAYRSFEPFEIDTTDLTVDLVVDRVLEASSRVPA